MLTTVLVYMFAQYTKHEAHTSTHVSQMPISTGQKQTVAAILAHRSKSSMKNSEAGSHTNQKHIISPTGMNILSKMVYVSKKDTKVTTYLLIRENLKLMDNL